MAQIIQAKDLRAGNTIKFKNNIYLVLENSFNKTAMREGIVKCKIKNLRTSDITVEVLTGEKLEQANIQKSKSSFSYINGNNYVFMDLETFEEYTIFKDKLIWEKNFLFEGLEVTIIRHEEEILGIDLPEQITIELQAAEEGIQGSTVQTALKKAWLITGYEINVPQFIKTGDKVIVSTNDGKYISRGK